MAITLELSTKEHAALAEVAEAAGVDIETVLHGLIAQLSEPAEAPKPEVMTDPDAPEVMTDPDAAEEQRREQQEVEANIKRWHREAQPKLLDPAAGQAAE